MLKTLRRLVKRQKRSIGNSQDFRQLHARGAAVVTFGRPAVRMSGDGLRRLKVAAIFQKRPDARRPETVAGE